MATIHFTTTTTATPEQFVAAITDFGPGRSQIFGNTDDGQLVVHESGPGWADVTEGKGGIWERLRYDWSDPSRTTMTTTDSNTWGGASGHTYTYERRPDGITAIDVVVVREGKNAKGRAIGLLLDVVGRRMLTGQFAKTVKAVEARNAATPPQPAAG